RRVPHVFAPELPDQASQLVHVVDNIRRLDQAVRPYWGDMLFDGDDLPASEQQVYLAVIPELAVDRAGQRYHEVLPEELRLIVAVRDPAGDVARHQVAAPPEQSARIDCIACETVGVSAVVLPSPR